MARAGIAGLISLMLAAGAGCGPAAESATEPVASAELQEATETPGLLRIPQATAPPADVVRAFLEASRGGEQELATELLSAKAREVTSREGLVLDRAGPPTQEYQIGKVEFPAEDRQAAYVTSVWQEPAGESTRAGTVEVIWILRQQAEGWRIAGMATQAAGESQPSLLNFEDAADIRRIKGEVDGEPLESGDTGAAAIGQEAEGVTPAS